MGQRDRQCTKNERVLCPVTQSLTGAQSGNHSTGSEGQSGCRICETRSFMLRDTGCPHCWYRARLDPAAQRRQVPQPRQAESALSLDEGRDCGESDLETAQDIDVHAVSILASPAQLSGSLENHRVLSIDDFRRCQILSDSTPVNVGFSRRPVMH